MNVQLSQMEFRWVTPKSPPSEAPDPTPSSLADDFVEVDGRRVALVYQRHPRAKRYRLFVDGSGQARVTLPRRGSMREARKFVAAHEPWLVNQLRRHGARRADQQWGPDTQILWRGQTVRLNWQQPKDTVNGWIILGEQHRIEAPASLREAGADWRPMIERHLLLLAARELPSRVLELAAQHKCSVRKICVRNQRSRWGSCSRRGTICLNWRLIQTPPAVRDYIILHELMHLREMNHSRRFWAHVATVCPDYLESERWLKSHPELMG
jgi:predicted metal-dependent hydrolase